MVPAGAMHNRGRLGASVKWHIPEVGAPGVSR